MLEIPSTRLLGHSAGGAISTHFDPHYPHQVQSLTLVGSSSEANEKASKVYKSLAQKAEQEGGPAILKAVGLKDKPGVIAPHGPGFAKAARCMGGLYQNPPIHHDFKKLRVRSSSLSEKKTLWAKAAQTFSTAISRAHALKWSKIVATRCEDPEEFNQLLLNFVRGGTR